MIQKKEETKNKILLVTSNFEDIVLGVQSQTTDDSHYPIGLAYLYSYLESKGMNVELLSLNHKPFEICFKEVISKIENFSPDVVGFQILTANRVSSYRLIEHVHKNYPKIKLVIGGIHATVMYKQLIEKYPFLVAVLGEGEITFTELIKEFSKKKPNFRKIDGLAFYENKKVVRTKPRQLIKDIDALPFPKHELFFKNSKRYSGCLLTSRGCPYSCSFCVLNPEAKRIVRFRSPKNVVDEIEYMVKKFPQMTEIFIHDDSFFINNERVIEICKEIVRRRIKLKLVCSGRIKPLSKELINSLEEAGFVRVMLGIESGDNGILKACHKGITQEDIINAFKLFSKSKINLKTFLIVGLPGENINTIKESARLIQKIQKIKYVSFAPTTNLLVVYPGTEVYELAKQKGMIEESFWLSDKETPIYTAEHRREKLKKFGEILADHISFNRVITPKGFKAQFTMIPYLLKYLAGKIIWKIKKQQ